MDIREAGTKSDFWIRAKIKLIDLLLGSLKIKNTKILDIGCGTGEDLEVLNRYGKVYVTDTDKKTLAILPRKLYIEKKLCSAEDIAFPSNSFDIIVAFDVLEHVKDDRKAISEILRLLRRGGYFIFTVPAFQALYSAHDKFLKHYRRYNKAMLLDLLSDFKIKKLGYWNSLLFPSITIFRVMRKGYETADTMIALPSFSNEALFYLLCGENLAAKINLPMPFGLSIYGICRKP